MSCWDAVARLANRRHIMSCYRSYTIYEQVNALPDAYQQALVLMIDEMVKQAQVEKIAGKRAGKK